MHSASCSSLSGHTYAHRHPFGSSTGTSIPARTESCPDTGPHSLRDTWRSVPSRRHTSCCTRILCKGTAGDCSPRLWDNRRGHPGKGFVWHIRYYALGICSILTLLPLVDTRMFLSILIVVSPSWRAGNGINYEIQCCWKVHLIFSHISSPVSDKRMPFSTKDIRIKMTDLTFKWTHWNLSMIGFITFSDFRDHRKYLFTSGVRNWHIFCSFQSGSTVSAVSIRFSRQNIISL